MVEKRWRGACKESSTDGGGLNDTVFPLLPSDSELAAAFVDRRRRCQMSINCALYLVLISWVVCCTKTI